MQTCTLCARSKNCWTVKILLYHPLQRSCVREMVCWLTSSHEFHDSPRTCSCGTPLSRYRTCPPYSWPLPCTASVSQTCRRTKIHCRIQICERRSQPWSHQQISDHILFLILMF